MDLAGYKKELTLEMLNEKGQVAKRYFLHGCWVSEYTAMPDLDANANAVAIESLKFELEGWERDPGTGEPDEAGG
jgi:phage tail-like protein